MDNPHIFHIIVYMERKPTAKCENGHDAHKVCTLKSCPHPALICKQPGCESISKHQKCLMKISLDELVQMLIAKGT